MAIFFSLRQTDIWNSSLKCPEIYLVLGFLTEQIFWIHQFVAYNFKAELLQTLYWRIKGLKRCDGLLNLSSHRYRPNLVNTLTFTSGLEQSLVWKMSYKIVIAIEYKTECLTFIENIKFWFPRKHQPIHPSHISKAQVVPAWTFFFSFPCSACFI